MSSSTSSDIVVQTRNLGKAYQLYARRNDWLKQVMFGWWKSYFKPFWVLRDIDLRGPVAAKASASSAATAAASPPCCR